MNQMNRLCAGLLSVACIFATTLLADEKGTTQATMPEEKAAEKSSSLQINATGEISKDDIKKISVALGHYLGRNLTTPGITFDLDSVIQGMREGVSGKPAPMTDKEFEGMIAQLQKRAHEKQSENNLKAANDFMQENANKKNIKVIEPGKLQYEVLQEGTGATVQAHGNPQINYTGKFIDGSVFSSSVDVGGPINVPLDQTIPGFSKGILGMKEGEKRRLFIHPDYGYGTLGQLPPNSLLIFDIEVMKAEAPKTSHADDEEMLPLSVDDEDADEDEEHHDHKKEHKPEQKNK